MGAKDPMVFPARMYWITAALAFGAMFPACIACAQQSGGQFVSDDGCRDCHTEQFSAWQGSHHAKAMDHATAETVLGDFDDVTFENHGVTSRFFRRDGQFFVETEGASGETAEFQVAYVFGVEPLQQYLIEFPGGRLQALSIAWDTEKKRWFHLYPGERITHDDPLHWTGLYQNWNMMCGECHTTNYEKNYDPENRIYETRYSAMNVGCQACHGPAEEHLAWANSPDPVTGAKPIFSSLVATGQAGQVGQCAQCHSRRAPVTGRFEHGRQILDQFNPALLRPELYHPDGQILDEVYVYGSFIQSKKYRAGVTCTDCHNPHTAALKATGNALCVQCHKPAGNDAFTTLKKADYDAPAHHRHAADSAGVQCVSCHMPAKYYMVVDERHDHSFRIPRPDLSVKLGVPNSCNQCHVDQTPHWAVAALKEWGVSSSDTADFAESLHALRNGDMSASQPLIDYLSDSGNPAIKRATAVVALPVQSREQATAIVEAAFDADPLVRAAAIDQAERLPDSLRLQVAMRALGDESHLVRLQAAKALADIPLLELAPEQNDRISAAFHAYIEAHSVMADAPVGQFNLAVFYERRGDHQKAEGHYAEAIRLDPSFLPARFNLANYLNSRGRNKEAETTLRDGLRWAPENGELYYSLGLLLAEEKRFEEAASTLETAVLKAPENPRGHYNYALVLQQLDRLNDAEQVLTKAYNRFPRDLDIPNALMHLNMRMGDLTEAGDYLKIMQSAYPDDPNLAQIRRLIESQLRGQR